MQCLLCLESILDPTECIQVDSEQWLELNIKELIEKYLWKFEPMTSSEHICSLCWVELNNFHRFFTRVEEAQCQNKLLLNVIKDPLEDDTKSTDLHEILIEEDITRETLIDMTVEIKEENVESPASMHINDNSQDNSVPSDVEYGEIIEYNIGYSDEDVDNSSEVVKSKGKAAIGSYQYSKSNQREYDDFLKEHFKFTCDRCQLPLDKFRSLVQHYRKEHDEQGFAICCETKFYNRRLLVDHINCHLNPDYFKCKLCGKTFSKRLCLLSHLRLHEGKKHTCDECGKKFVQKFKLDKHKLTHLPESERKFSCKECGKTYADEYMLTRHQRIVHLNAYAKVCEICGQVMPDAYSFKRHMEKHEGIPSPNAAKCDICGLILTCQASLRLHKELKHPVDGKREYNCHICKKISPNMRALKKHIRESHEIGYQYKCTVCPKEFKRSDNFKAHMATHTGTPLFRCPWCPKEFNANGSMHKHRKTVHPLEWEAEKRKKYSGNLPPDYKRESKEDA